MLPCMSTATILTFRADPGEITDERVRFTGVAYSGGVIENYHWLGAMAIDLADIQMPETLTVLRNHDNNQIVGRASLAVQNGQLVVTEGEITEATEAGREIAALMREGHPWQLSIGVQGKMEEQKPGTAPAKINGKKLAAAVIMRSPRILELSFVPAGADANTYVAQMSARYQEPEPEEPTMTDTTELAELQAQLAELKAQLEDEQAARAEAEQKLAEIEQTRKAEKVKALFAAMGKPEDADTEPYMAMSEAQLEALAADLSAVKPTVPESLTTETATGGVDMDDKAQLAAKAREYANEHNVTIVQALQALGVK